MSRLEISPEKSFLNAMEWSKDDWSERGKLVRENEGGECKTMIGEVRRTYTHFKTGGIVCWLNVMMEKFI